MDHAKPKIARDVLSKLLAEADLVVVEESSQSDVDDETPLKLQRSNEGKRDRKREAKWVTDRADLARKRNKTIYRDKKTV